MEESCFGNGAAEPDVSDEGEKGSSVITALSGVIVQEVIKVTFLIF